MTRYKIVKNNLLFSILEVIRKKRENIPFVIIANLYSGIN